MDEIYLLKVNVGIALFYIFYKIVCSRDTFFQWHRCYLMSCLVISWLYPLCYLFKFTNIFDQSAQIQTFAYLLVEEPVEEMLYPLFSSTTEQLSPVFPSAPAVGGLDLLLDFLTLIYLAGVVLFASRFLVQLFSILYLVRGSSRKKWGSYTLVELKDPRTPFSFFHWIFLSSFSEVDQEEYLQHEIVHCRQKHSIDILFSEIVGIFCWFNPLMWLLKCEIRLNLEYLADDRTTQILSDNKSYQYHLLNVCNQKKQTGLYNNFNVLHLKSRIMMMNKKRTASIGRMKYVMYLPIVCALLLMNQVSLIAQEKIIDKDQIIIMGLVKDEAGNPLVDAKITIQGISYGTMTDEKGIFKLIAPRKKQILIVSRLGMKTLYHSIQPSPEKSVIPVSMILHQDPAFRGAIPRLDVYSIVETMPQFPGNFVAYLKKNLKYPSEAQANGISGTVYVKFIIEKDGTISNVRVVKSIDPFLDEEAIRLIQNMPKWKPGKHKEKNVAVEFVLPIRFDLKQR